MVRCGGLLTLANVRTTRVQRFSIRILGRSEIKTLLAGTHQRIYERYGMERPKGAKGPVLVPLVLPAVEIW